MKNNYLLIFKKMGKLRKGGKDKKPSSRKSSSCK